MGTKASLSSQTAASLACLHAAGDCTSFWCGWKQILCCPSRIEAWIHLLCIGGLLSGCVRQGPCASEALLADDDPAVLADLTHRMQRREELSQHEKPSSTEWADHHMKMAESLRVRWGQGAQPNVSNNSWYKTLTDREQDALPLLQVQSPGSLMRDLSQSINRANAFTWKAEAGKHIAPTMLPKMNLWLEPVPPRNAARLMLGREALLFQGFPALLFFGTLGYFSSSSGGRWPGCPSCAAVKYQAACEKGQTSSPSQ